MPTFQRILVPIDFSACSRAALEYAVALAARLGAAVDVLHVWEPPPYAELPVPPPATREEILSDFSRTPAAHELEAVVDRLEKRGVKVMCRIDSGPVAATIARNALAYDMVVMGTHGRTGLPHLFLGSVAEKVVRLAERPVVTVRAPQDQRRTTPT